ncbi:MAG: hypothetical protein DLM68_10760 [Hyphomicrobiales bacterium]|nr:MAG: hypothetical protein DLM68_10760 [Hyphomicrobiales bacterium]
MPFIASLAQNAFDPESVRVLEIAFDSAWKTVISSGSDLALNGRAASTREALARRIIAMAERGETDPRRLIDDALAHLAASRQDDAPPKLSG